MSEEPTLPRLPAVSWDEQSQSFSNNPRKRVRNPHGAQHASSLKYNSSDPAVFSSDDDPALDNYVQGRRKKRYVGSWFQQQPASSSDSTFGEPQPLQITKKRRPFARQPDSGVYLGSDGNESDDLMELLEISTKPRLPQLDRPTQPDRPAVRRVSRVSKAEQAARDKVRACLDQGEETIDFWSMGLEEISNDAISPLSQFECIPVVTKDVAFEQKDPELKIYLAMNRLTRVPGALFDLTHITILSLRGNKLTELPPAISQLHNLTELNVSQNRLRHLPVELLDLFGVDSKLHTLVIHPNPFWQPEQSLEDEDKNESEAQTVKPVFFQYDQSKEDVSIPHLVSRTLGRSPSQLINTSGRIFSDFKFPSDYRCHELPVEAHDADNDKASAEKLKGATAVPSFVEVALRACYQSAQLSEMGPYIPEGLSHLRQLLERALKQKEAGGIVCSRCRKSIVVPTAEWVEWKDIRTCEKVTQDDAVQARVVPLSMAEGEIAVPFIHRGCSWRCGPTSTEKGSWRVPEGYPAPHVLDDLGYHS